MIKLAIVEDVAEERKAFERFVHKYEQEHSVSFSLAVYDSAESFLREFHLSTYDLIFLDIILPGMNGMELARKIREYDSQVLIIFVTSTPQFAVEGYSVHAQDYLLKPIAEFDLSQLLKRYLMILEEREDKYCLFRSTDGVKRFRYGEILYIESLRHRITVHTNRGDFQVKETMRDLEARLSHYYFFRCNSGYLVNLKRVTGFSNGYAELGEIRLMVSRPRKKAFLEALTSYIGEIVK